MNPSFSFVWVLVLAILLGVRAWDRRRGNEHAAKAWSALAWMVLGMGLARVFVWDPVVVQGSSMLPTLSNSQVVIVDKHAFGIAVPVFGYRLGGRVPQVGDIVVFDGPDGESWVKRVAGVPGDRVVHIEGRGWFRDDVFLAPDDPRTRPDWMTLSGARSTTIENRRALEVYIRPGRVFLIGDNPAVSVDSRRIGLVHVSRLQGRVP